MNPTDQHKLTIYPSGKRVQVDHDSTVLKAAQTAGIAVNAVCGGNGTCGSCKVALIAGDFTPISPIEKQTLNPNELADNTRLACITRVLSDGVVQFPVSSLATTQRLQLEAEAKTFEIQPAVTRLEIEIDQNLSGQKQSTIEQVREALKIAGHVHSDLPAEIIETLRTQILPQGGKISLALNGEQVITMIPLERRLLGLAVDVGTTKLAAYLVDLQTGVTIASEGATNPQIAFGEDVLSRIKYCDDHPGGGLKLQQLLVSELNALCAQLTASIETSPREIVDVVIVGNTAMQHLLADLPVHSLGTAPYHPTRLDSMNIQASQVDLRITSNANIWIPPNVAGFVGGDHVAMLLACGAWKATKTTLAVDIGTNTEISLVHKGRHLACSCASGPAFEGAHIREGVRAIPGAIERVFIDADQIKVQTIRNEKAIGVCGSGILDAVAEFRRENLVDHRGAFNKTDPRLVWRGDHPEFVLVTAEDSGTSRVIALNRKDIHEVQLAKAAIRSGIEILLREAAIQAEEIDEVLVAGAFGTYLNLENAIRIGMFPTLPAQKFMQIGNAAGVGARELLLSTTKRAEAEMISQQIEYLELTTVKDYVDFYMDAISL